MKKKQKSINDMLKNVKNEIAEIKISYKQKNINYEI